MLPYLLYICTQKLRNVQSCRKSSFFEEKWLKIKISNLTGKWITLLLSVGSEIPPGNYDQKNHEQEGLWISCMSENTFNCSVSVLWFFLAHLVLPISSEHNNSMNCRICHFLGTCSWVALTKFWMKKHFYRCCWPLLQSTRTLQLIRL